MGKSSQDDLNLVRKPRVHIIYKVETEGAPEVKELPFVVGVLGDFSGNPTSELRPLSERKFINIDRDNFDAVLARMTPGLNLKVANTLQGDGSEMSVQLTFDKMEDFEPANVARQVEPLRKLLDARNKLKELQSKVDRSEKLENVLERILQNDEDVAKLAKELGDSSPEPGKDVK